MDILKNLDKEKHKVNRDEWVFVLFIYLLILFVATNILYPKTHLLTVISVVLPVQIVFRHFYYALYDP